MYNGIGLQIPRGSGTNGYIQTNKFSIKSRTGKVADSSRGFGTGAVTKKPNRDILEHDRKRHIELKLVVLEDKLIDQGLPTLRSPRSLTRLGRLSKLPRLKRSVVDPALLLFPIRSKVSDTQTHQIAARKEKQTETLRAVLGLAAPESADKNTDDIEDGLKRTMGFYFV
nr:pre-mRNA-splicing factor cwc-21-like [Malus domestica]